MSIFEMFHKKEAPIDEEKGVGSGETMGVSEEDKDLHVSQDGAVLNDEEYKDIIERRKLGIKQD